jgi:hypothetical protein
LVPHVAGAVTLHALAQQKPPPQEALWQEEFDEHAAPAGESCAPQTPKPLHVWLEPQLVLAGEFEQIPTEPGTLQAWQELPLHWLAQQTPLAQIPLEQVVPVVQATPFALSGAQVFVT